MEVIKPHNTGQEDFKEHLVIGDDQGQLHMFSFMKKDWHMCNLSSPCEVSVTTSNLEDKYKDYYRDIKHMQQDKESTMQQSQMRPKNQPKKTTKDFSNNITH